MARKKWIHSFPKYVCAKANSAASARISNLLYASNFRADKRYAIHTSTKKKQTEKQNEQIMKENKTTSLKDNEKIKCIVGSKRDKQRGE